jgi:hypothetical protein
MRPFDPGMSGVWVDTLLESRAEIPNGASLWPRSLAAVGWETICAHGCERRAQRRLHHDAIQIRKLAGRLADGLLDQKSAGRRVRESCGKSSI